MVDAVTSITVYNGGERIMVRLTNRSDGSGEADVIKIDKSTLVNSAGVEPAQLMLEEAWYSIQGFSSVQLEWDHTTDDTMDIFSGNGLRCYDPPLQDPRTAGGTGDVLLTTFGAVANATYDFLLTFRKSA